MTLCNVIDVNFDLLLFLAPCKRKEEPPPVEQPPAPKKPRLVFTDLQRRTLQAIFKVRTWSSSICVFLSEKKQNAVVKRRNQVSKLHLFVTGNETTIQRNASDDSQAVGTWTDDSWQFLHERTSPFHGQVERRRRWTKIAWCQQHRRRFRQPQSVTDVVNQRSWSSCHHTFRSRDDAPLIGPGCLMTTTGPHCLQPVRFVNSNPIRFESE